ncbi:cofactor assembly of complex C subunit B [Gloeocapsopsis crepidinum LEGE 06123]|uniref:Cofactor assembly of complex C subunit B n=2 Tax=Gloeocapsopsis crepidinum TaxID=693223 RepID=A0ABR9US91_9CHRO|nr:cofactor assembly of complex C subunit B [Gloeocapsopsis crepidinum LEGE 06123]
MSVTSLASTLVLTLLLAVGLFFFIRASVKDRTQEVTLVFEQEETSMFDQLQQYFAHRSYRVATIDSAQNQVTYEGFVKPSIFLAIFLTLLAAIGILCLALVWSLLFPGLSSLFLVLVLLSPVAGIFYWKKAGRPERVLLKLPNQSNELPHELQNQITVVAHRDELIELQRSLRLKSSE